MKGYQLAKQMLAGLYLGCTTCTDKICLSPLRYSAYFWVVLCFWDSKTLTHYTRPCLVTKNPYPSPDSLFSRNSI